MKPYSAPKAEIIEILLEEEIQYGPGAGESMVLIPEDETGENN